ncbi:polysaccharide biosynthesis tyrosine autokinase [Amphritea opalescens]|uniref:non-specific protein-tyrosine kinase n=1 Tax=Amphritea opalescens TaxID=2490544 RepID=A0A430KNZ8_9GAMM|nr:polysaccharide biosynthesis tyrosine autokinase [Amphritea opalescens]RTE65217.1 polysaccharide biosynthesis tyrosine autokinase [Amphritea opalescens]
METNNSQENVSRLMGDDVIDLRQYWNTINRHKWGIFGFAIVVTMLTTLVVFSMKPIYRAEATLLIESQNANVVSIEEVYGLDSGNSEYYLTQFEILKSRQLAERVIDKLNLIDHPEFNQAPGFIANTIASAKALLPLGVVEEPSEEEMARIKLQNVTSQLIGNLTIEPIRKTQLVKISYDSYEPLLSAEIANAVGDAYIENNLEARLQLTMKASGWLMERLSGLREKLKVSEQNLQQYREQEQIVGSDGGFDIANNELDMVASKHIEARRERMALESLNRQIKKLDRRNPENFELIPAILQHPLVQSLKGTVLQAELKKSELSKRYGAKHPKMKAAQSELDNARRSLNAQILSVVNGIENEYRLALSAERSLKAAVDQTKRDLQSINRKDYRLKELEKEVDANRQLYDTFFTRLSETNATGDLQSANARISDPAQPPRGPEKPKKGLIMALAFVVSIMFGIMFSFLLEALNNTIKTAQDVESKLGATMLGLLPKLAKSKKTDNVSYTAYLDENQSAFAESVRTIRTGIVLSALDNPHKILCVTSSAPGEGKTSLTLSLAYSLGQMEKVLLIDADMRRPSIAKAFGLSGKSAGLSNLVAGTAKLEETIHKDEKSGIDILPSGIIPPNPLELLSSARFAKVLEVLETKYDRIVIDTAPTQAVSDALVLSHHVGAMIYVVKADATNYQLAKNGLKRLNEVKAPLIGVVLNQVDIKKSAKYGDDYYGYYDVYGYTAEK